ncbi:unnamed protein product [Trypanosoma congolense IL3000]|uniref:WGS project CAEQ00000000 data, annotated contig 949 n=1 Tax=Trypanosoma congolense (strain IL3000) TaxID=1068625 RepID=F9WJT8_TRYCI|nr:unnamed protein product [Trypanosoma congolense IL3000]
MSVVLDVIPNENYEPSESELLEYGRWLGMNLPEDKPFLWIAREGLRAPLPEHWKACRSEKGELYYFNFKTGESIWDHPLDNHFKELLKNEKENPSPQSIANGAKKPAVQPDTASKPLCERSTNQEERITTSGSKSKLHALKTLKQKRELPEELRIDYKSGSNSGSESVERSRTAQKLKGVLSAAGLAGAKIPPLTSPPESVAPLPVVGKGVLAVKPNSGKPKPSISTSAPLSDVRGPSGANLREPLQPSGKVSEEEEEQYKIRIKSLKDDLEKKFQEEKEILEKEYTNNMNQMHSDFTTRLENEKKKHQLLEEEHNEELSKARQRWQAEIDALIDDKTKEIEEVKNADSQLLTVMTQIKQSLDNHTLEFISAYESAYNSFVEVVCDTNEKHSKLIEPTLSKLLDRASEIYRKSVNSMNDCFALEVENIKLRFAEKISLMEKECQQTLENVKKQEGDSPPICGGAVAPTPPRKISTKTCSTQYEREHFYESNGGSDEVERANNTPCGDNSDTQPLKEMIGTVIELLKEDRSRLMELLGGGRKEPAEEVSKLISESNTREPQQVVEGVLVGVESEPAPVQQASVESPKDDGGRRDGLSNTTSIEVIRKEDLTDALIDAFRSVFVNMSSYPCFNHKDITPVKESMISDKVPTPSAIPGSPIMLDQQLFGFPIPMQEQKSLLGNEMERLVEVKKIMDKQRAKLDKRRAQLKAARNRWKRDVMLAKKEGVKASSQQGQLLTKVHHVLDSQIKNLEYEEAILKGSEEWFQMKKKNIDQMKQQIRAAERTNSSLPPAHDHDTAVITRDLLDFDSARNDRHPTACSTKLPGESIDTLTQVLNKIVRRLEKVATTINNRGKRRCFSIS